MTGSGAKKQATKIMSGQNLGGSLRGNALGRQGTNQTETGKNDDKEFVTRNQVDIMLHRATQDIVDQIQLE